MYQAARQRITTRTIDISLKDKESEMESEEPFDMTTAMVGKTQNEQLNLRGKCGGSHWILSSFILVARPAQYAGLHAGEKTCVRAKADAEAE